MSDEETILLSFYREVRCTHRCSDIRVYNLVCCLPRSLVPFKSEPHWRVVGGCFRSRSSCAPCPGPFDAQNNSPGIGPLTP